MINTIFLKLFPLDMVSGGQERGGVSILSVKFYFKENSSKTIWPVITTGVILFCLYKEFCLAYNKIEKQNSLHCF